MKKETIKHLKKNILALFVMAFAPKQRTKYISIIIAAFFEFTNSFLKDKNKVLAECVKEQNRGVSRCQGKWRVISENSEFKRYKQLISHLNNSRDEFIWTSKAKTNIIPDSVECFSLFNHSISYSQTFYFLQQLVIWSLIGIVLVEFYYFSYKPDRAYTFCTRLLLSLLIIAAALYYGAVTEWVIVERNYLEMIIEQNNVLLNKMNEILEIQKKMLDSWNAWYKWRASCCWYFCRWTPHYANQPFEHCYKELCPRFRIWDRYIELEFPRQKRKLFGL